MKIGIVTLDDTHTIHFAEKLMGILLDILTIDDRPPETEIIMENRITVAQLRGKFSEEDLVIFCNPNDVSERLPRICIDFAGSRQIKAAAFYIRSCHNGQAYIFKEAGTFNIVSHGMENSALIAEKIKAAFLNNMVQTTMTTQLPKGKSQGTSKTG